MEHKIMYLVVCHLAKSDATNVKVFANKQNAEREFEYIKEFIKEEYNADEDDIVTKHYFARYDNSETNASFVQLLTINNTIEGKEINFSD